DASAAEVPQVKVTEVVPLSDDDPSGAGLAIAGLPLTIGGIVGGVLTSMGIRSRRMRAVGTLVYGAIGGLALALIMQTWFDILQGDFGLNVLAIGLSIAATAGLINGFVSLIGPAGIGIGAVLTMFIGHPIASLSQPKEFLAGAWGDIGQFFVPGAAGTLLRDLSYFPDAAVGLQWWVLIAWFVVGIVLILIGHLIAHRKTTPPAHCDCRPASTTPPAGRGRPWSSSRPRTRLDGRHWSQPSRLGRRSSCRTRTALRQVWNRTPPTSLADSYGRTMSRSAAPAVWRR